MEITFTTLTLFEADGTRLVLEADGEVWKFSGRSRSLVRTLTAAALEELRRELIVARPEAWTGSGGSSYLVLESAAGTFKVDLPSSDRTIMRILALIRGNGA